MNKPKLQLNYPFFPQLLTRNGGFLPNEKAAHACWYFYTLAQKSKEKIGDTTADQFGLLEENEWMDKRYEDQARSIAMLYGLESPDDFLRYFPEVAKQAKALRLPEPAPEYMRPLRRFIASTSLLKGLN